MGDISYIAESAIYGEVFKKTSSKAKNGHRNPGWPLHNTLHTSWFCVYVYMRVYVFVREWGESLILHGA